MLFLNPWLLAGLAGAALPVIIHLVRQQAAKPVDWGAMRFLFDTISIRRRKMEWEDLLLMATRCLLLALAALAVARPFVPPDSGVPWLFVLPAALLGIALAGGSFVLGNAKARWLVRTLGGALLLAAAGFAVMEKFLNLKRFETSGRRDVALVIDASASMELTRGGSTVFQQAVEEARQLVKEAPAGTAFSVIRGGPAPEALTAAPLTHRADVLGVLDSLEPVGGTFRAHDALGMATLGLAEGTGASKQIIVFTDSQRSGWRLDHPGAWDSLQDVWRTLPARPKLLVRDFGAPVPFRNVALGELELSRSLIGTDRDVMIRASVENTGTEPLTPGPVVLEIDGEPVGEAPVGLLLPGQSETAEFHHRFRRAGASVIAARLEAADDLASDDRAERVATVRERLPVLLVEGNPAGSFFDRASGYAALALAPSAAVIGGDRADERFLMDPRVVSATALQDEDVDAAAVVVLADVPRLPAGLATRIAGKIAEGAGLFVIAGPRAQADFYNDWDGADGPLLPLTLGAEAADPAGVAPAPATFQHESLAIFADAGDLATARVERWRKTGSSAGAGIQAAAFSNGDTFLATRGYGNGRVLLATCAFDARSGNLPARRAFVPLVHELVTWTAGGGVELNTAASWSPTFVLRSMGGGLSARYSRDRQREVRHERTDPAIDFDWGNGRPAPGVPVDQFSVHWAGELTPPVSGEYLFSADVDDEFAIRIDGRSMNARRGQPELGRMTLRAGVPVPIEADFREEGGEAFVHLFWTPPGGTRQIVPTSALQPAEAKALEMKSLDPRGQPRAATVTSGRRGRELAIAGPALPGVYRVSTGGVLADILPAAADGVLPVAVSRDPGESRFEPMTPGDLALIRGRIDLLQPRSVADMLGVMTGKGFGRGIWKWLAAAAFVLFLLEGALARWVSRSRRTAETVRVDFGEATVWRGGR